MKHSLLVFFSLLSFSSMVLADQAEKHQSLCDGHGSACRIVISTKPAPAKNGKCLGMFRGFVPCVTTFASVEAGTTINMTCGIDPAKPILNQDFAAEAISYNVAAIVTGVDGKNTVVSDANNYTIIDSGVVSVSLTEQEGSTYYSGNVSFILETGPVELTAVSCF